MKKSILVISVLTLPLLSFAADVTVCKNGAMERRVEVGSTDAATKVPCEVKYFKEGDPAGKVLWNATNDATYCEMKAKEFTDKLSAAGWQCTASAAAAEAPAPAK